MWKTLAAPLPARKSAATDMQTVLLQSLRPEIQDLPYQAEAARPQVLKRALWLSKTATV